ncbi:MAG: hypothetical protein ACT4UQ_01670 [Gammaproteobacteria bacterium]
MNLRIWLAFILVPLVVLAGCSGKKEESESSDAAKDQASLVASSEVVSTADVKSLGALVDLIVAEAGELPRAEFDPAALAKQLGDDPQAHFEWVRDHTWWAPYRGLLRGSKGVMLDRVGSNLDRAVLLGDLLRHAGYTVRLAHSELPEARARDVLAKVRPIPDQRRNPPAVNSLSPERKRQMEAVIPGYASNQQRSSAVQQFAEEARALVRSQADQLQTAMQDLASDSARSEDRVALAAMKDHWWVERKDGDQWVAMDVLLPDSKPGVALVVASKLSDWKAEASEPSIPASEWHTVQLRIVIERYDGSATTESTVLDTALHPARVIDRPIRLRHMPKPWPDNLPGPESDPNALGNAAVNVPEWIPFLQIGDELISQSGFTASGDSVADPLNPQRDIAAAGGVGFMSGFSEALGGGETAASSLTAEWIDYEIRAPGASAKRIRRPVFDLLGPVQRSNKAEGVDVNTNDHLITRSEALLSQTDIFLQPCEISSEFVSHLVSASIVDNEAVFRELAAENRPDKAHEKAVALLGRIDFWGPLPDLAQWRSELSAQPVNWVVDQPNVLNFRISPPVVNADRATLKQMIDIVSNAIGVRPGASQSAFPIRLHQGVADTVAELVALGGELRGAENTASLFASVTAAVVGTKIGPREKNAVDALGWTADATVKLTGNLDQGFVVFALKQAVELDGQARVGWWRVDPATGETIGVMDTGFHQTQTEDPILRVRIALREYLDKDWAKWASRQVARAGGQRYVPSVEREMAIRQAAIKFREALLDFVETTGPRGILP